MIFCIITHVIHTKKDNQFFAYLPYINEMNIWLKFVDEVLVVAPKEDFELNPIHTSYQHKKVKFIEINKFNTLSFLRILQSFLTVPINCWRIFKAMQKADHIHLRCPGNIGLLGCFVQILFPNKKKTAKYAGNWEANSKQPLSYKLQKWILSSTFLTKNIQVLVYGEWKNQTKNIKSFFTATYNEKDIAEVQPRILNDNIKFLFVGTLTSGKQPFYALQIVEKLIKNGVNATLSFYGEGTEKEILSKYILHANLQEFISIKGISTKEDLKTIYQNSHFLILPSKSEGWPKVVAEAMFWACVPIATKVSCIPTMLDYGNRGFLLSENLADDVNQIQELCTNQKAYQLKATLAKNWSREFTTDKFEAEIKNLV